MIAIFEMAAVVLHLFEIDEIKNSVEQVEPCVEKPKALAAVSKKPCLVGDFDDNDGITRAEKYNQTRQSISGANISQEEIKQLIIDFSKTVVEKQETEMQKVLVDSSFTKFIHNEIENDITAKQIKDQQWLIAIVVKPGTKKLYEKLKSLTRIFEGIENIEDLATKAQKHKRVDEIGSNDNNSNNN
ncbi:MAG: hypothetical protein EZS28_023273 [Streblomastix strix]|uniref:Uncharacterized protein n=1 Tax=Streblomastix strix TaxID=222440 RepID=A0A5J4VFJ8_9EUKA|nr:MAG: hypothetical protein EZS28_023273 [Streblomastix strix]